MPSGESKERREAKQMLIRLPIEVHAKVAALAALSGSSLNGMVVQFVEEGIARMEAETPEVGDMLGAFSVAKAALDQQGVALPAE